jgi:guanylate kinase
MKKKIIILGKSASGKDTLSKLLCDQGLRMSVSHTTRPMRKHEKDGIDYHFISLEDFEKKESENFFLESEKFREWKYGRSVVSIENADVLILTVKGVSSVLEKYSRDSFYIIETISPDGVRIERSMKRGDSTEEIFRRLKADEIDFNQHRNFTVDEILETQDYSSYEDLIEKVLKL